MASVLIGDLASDVTEEELYKIFSQAGTVLSVKVCRESESGRCLGYGYVLYQEPKEAEKAVEMFNLDLIHNQHIRVTMADTSNQSHFLKGNVFVKNLDRTVDSNILHQAFSSFGKVLSCKVPQGKKGSKCHGFVQLDTEEAAQSAITTMNGTTFYGKKIYVGHFVNRDQRELTSDSASSSGVTPSSLRTVYIKNLSPTVDSTFLKITCSPYGDVANVKIIRDTDGSSKGFAFITFKRVEEAAKAIEVLNGKEVDGRILFAGPAIKKAGRKQQQQHKQHPLQQQQQKQQQQHQQHQQQQLEDVRELCVGESVRSESAMLCPACDQWPKVETTRSVQLLPAVSCSREPHMLHQLPQNLGRASSPTLHLPSITTLTNKNTKVNRLLPLPQISQSQQKQHQQQQQQQQQQLHSHLQQHPLQQQSGCEIHQQQEKQPGSKQHRQQKVKPAGQEQQNMEHKQNQQQQQQQPPTPQQQQQQQQQMPMQHQTLQCQKESMCEGGASSSVVQGVNLYVKHLDDHVDDAILKEMFSKYGEVISAKVMMEGERSRGFGFVCFARAEDAARATRDMRRKVDAINRRPLYVAPAQRKEERQAFFREKLKSRQSDIHSGDMKGAQKVITALENIKDTEGHAISESPDVLFNLPGGDSTGKSTKAECGHGQVFADLAKRPDSAILPSRTNTKFSKTNRTRPVRSNVFNFEIFNIDNMRTPLIKPTRVSDPLHQRCVSAGDQTNPDSSCYCLCQDSSNVEQSCSANIFSPSPKFPPTPEELVKHPKEVEGIGGNSHNTSWKVLDSDPATSTGVFSGSSVKLTAADVGEDLAPIGCNPHSRKNDIKKGDTKNAAERSRASHPYKLRPRTPSRASFSLADNMGHRSPSVRVRSNKSTNKGISFSGSAQNVPQCFAFRQELSTFDTLYDPLNAISFSKIVVSEKASSSSQQGKSPKPTSSVGSDANSGTENCPGCGKREAETVGRRRVLSLTQSLESTSSTRGSHLRAASLHPDPGYRRSPNLKRRCDTSCDLDIDHVGYDGGSHWPAKRRMLELPVQQPLGDETHEQVNSDQAQPKPQPQQAADDHVMLADTAEIEMATPSPPAHVDSPQSILDLLLDD